ncbi:cysteine desulfurase [Mobilitalea sibirica]|uniref:Cysteine desulfurase n=1 Tax=Mobilitalea sibirica TaxID=1462919 RepID=A0A8J7L0E9_9FIRM|nr:cysteine desulfurase family protein [Mobilitalea sibirica]MBH1942213.1 cysteine desulfurase [Mobilitalea sibirica]
MIYLDYAANTPVDQGVLDCFCKESLGNIANPNSRHKLGTTAKERLEEITQHMAELLQVKPNEIIYTSGASEANNLAIKGLVQAYKHNGKHIISTCLEHSSVSGALTYLQSLGYEIDLVDITEDGLVDINHLKELLRKDTVLVSICYVDSELGILQQIKDIGALLLNYPNCYFHTDATQAIGKVPVSFENIDLMTFTPHKFYGLNGCGVLIKRESVIIEPLIHGGSSTTLYRSGTPDLAMAAALCKALETALVQLEERFQYIRTRNEDLKQFFTTFSKVRINSTEYCIPHILNISIQGVKAVTFTDALEKEGICVSIKSACSVQNSPSRPVYAITKDRKNAMSSFRISLSHLTTEEEINIFKEVFTKCYHRLTS